MASLVSREAPAPAAGPSADVLSLVLAGLVALAVLSGVVGSIPW